MKDGTTLRETELRALSELIKNSRINDRELRALSRIVFNHNPKSSEFSGRIAALAPVLDPNPFEN